MKSLTRTPRLTLITGASVVFVCAHTGDMPRYPGSSASSEDAAHPADALNVDKAVLRGKASLCPSWCYSTHKCLLRQVLQEGRANGERDPTLIQQEPALLERTGWSPAPKPGLRQLE